jgi:predicted aconitase with swiveling domain
MSSLTSTSDITLTGAPLVAGTAAGPTLTLQAPVSLWNGLDTTTGRIIEPDHPDHGADITGTILIIPAVKGATASIGLTECLRTGHGPAGLVLAHRDVTIVTASVVAGLLYDRQIPVLHLPLEQVAGIPSGVPAHLTDGTLRLGTPPTFAVGGADA